MNTLWWEIKYQRWRMPKMKEFFCFFAFLSVYEADGRDPGANLHIGFGECGGCQSPGRPMTECRSQGDDKGLCRNNQPPLFVLRVCECCVCIYIYMWAPKACRPTPVRVGLRRRRNKNSNRENKHQPAARQTSCALSVRRPCFGWFSRVLRVCSHLCSMKEASYSQ
jgi:hypothetical protein